MEEKIKKLVELQKVLEGQVELFAREMDELKAEIESTTSTETENITWDDGDIYWYIDYDGRIYEDCYQEKYDRVQTKFGNLFKTEEEAELAVKKLHAFKRLRDKGFKFEGIREDYTRFPSTPDKCFRDGRRYLQFNKAEDVDWMKENWKDLDLLFGEEE